MGISDLCGKDRTAKSGLKFKRSEGFSGGFFGALLYGSGLSDAFSAGLDGALSGAIGGALSGAIGAAAKAYQWGASCKALAQGVRGSVVNLARGDSIESGFFSGFAGSVTGGVQLGTFGQAVAASMVGGVTSMIGGGKFENGAIAGALAVISIKAYSWAAKHYQDQVGRKPDWRPGSNKGDSKYTYSATGRQLPGTERNNVFGLNQPMMKGKLLNPLNLLHQKGIVSRLANMSPGMNALAGLHDYWFNSGQVKYFLLTNVPTMPPAALITAGAFINEATQYSTYSMQLEVVSYSVHIKENYE